MRLRARAELIDMMRRTGRADQVAEAQQILPEIVDLDRDDQLLYRLGLTRDHLVNSLGGSAW